MRADQVVATEDEARLVQTPPLTQGKPRCDTSIVAISRFERDAVKGMGLDVSDARSWRNNVQLSGYFRLHNRGVAARVEDVQRIQCGVVDDKGGTRLARER